MTATETALVVIAFVLFAAVVIAIAYARIESHEADNLAAKNGQLTNDLEAERAKVRHYQERNQQLRDELDLATGAVEPSLVTAWTAFCADIAPEDFR